MCPHDATSSLLCFCTAPPSPTIYTLSLHDALPISLWTTRTIASRPFLSSGYAGPISSTSTSTSSWRDRKSTRLNSSHLVISYAVFCLKKKKKKYNQWESAVYICNRCIRHIVKSLLV